MSKYGVFSGPYFPVFSPNTGKYGPEKTPHLDIFHAVSYTLDWGDWMITLSQSDQNLDPLSLLGFTCLILVTPNHPTFKCSKLTLTHYSPVLLFYAPWKHQKICRFSDVFRGYRKATPGCNELTSVKHNWKINLIGKSINFTLN